MGLILASASPRRRELMELLRVPFEIQTKDVLEDFDTAWSPSEVVEFLAEKKATAVFEDNQSDVIIGSDTVVAIGDEILGKPSSREEAIEMLTKLSGRTHSVFTGVSIISADISVTFYNETEVVFWELSQREIESYVGTNEPMDKAGAYGIQGYGATLVKEIVGDYYSVMGLPISSVKRVLDGFDLA